MIERKHLPFTLTLGAAALATGCAQVPMTPVDARSVDVAPVYRVNDIAGTAAGQYAVGRLDLAEGRVEAAIRRFRNAIAADPGYVEAYNGLGVASGMLGRYDDAASAFRNGLARAPDAPHLLNNLGFALMKSGQFEAAASALARSLEIDASSERTIENLRLLAELRRPGSPAGGQLAAATADVPSSGSTSIVEPVAANGTRERGVPVSAPVASPARDPMPESPGPVAVPARSPTPEPSGSMAASNRPVGVPLEPRPEPTRSAGAPVASAHPTPVVPVYEVVERNASASTLTAVAPGVYEYRLETAVSPVASASAAVPAPAAQPVQSIASGIRASGLVKPYAPPASAARDPARESAVAPLVERATGPSATPVARPAGTQPSVAAVSKPRPVATVRPPAPHERPESMRVTERRLPGDAMAQSRQLALGKFGHGYGPARISLDGVEVSNGVGIRRLAGSTANRLSRLGVGVVRVSDYQFFGLRQSQIHYRKGHEAAAEALRRSLPIDVQLVRSARLSEGVNVRLVVGRDLVAARIADADVEQPITGFGFAGSGAIPWAESAGVDLGAHARQVGRASVEDGWRFA